MHDWIAGLKALDISVGIVTASSRDQLMNKMKEANIRLDLFDAVHYRQSSTKAEMFYELFNRSETRYGLYIGDIVEDYLLSRRMGVDLIRVVTGRDSRDAFIKA
ncbi:hypothetical protein D3C75_270420 [compost metagenome]